jgi:hypothetical protein
MKNRVLPVDTTALAIYKDGYTAFAAERGSIELTKSFYRVFSIVEIDQIWYHLLDREDTPLDFNLQPHQLSNLEKILVAEPQVMPLKITEKSISKSI